MISGWIRNSRWLVVLAAVAVGAGCGDPEEPADPDDVGVDEDVGTDAGTDAGDVGQDVEDVEDVDDGPEFASDDGIDGIDDNCPELSNPDQVDRSRDGVGNACDNFPHYHDPSNPVALDVMDEEDGGPNDSRWDAIQNWMLDLPIVVEGTIEEEGELDWYGIEVDEPTSLLVHIEPKTQSMWPAMMVAGDDFSPPNRDFVSFILGANEGEPEVRDIHLPMPGTYMLAVSDFHNLSAEPGEAGGDDYEYRLSVTEPPLPDPEPISVPAPQQVVPYDEGEAHIFSVDVEGEDTLAVEATGAPRNQASVLFPAIQFLDGDTGEVLAYTIEDQADTDSLRNELTMKLGDHDRVDVLVEAHTSLGQNDIVVDIDAIDKPVHNKSVDNPRMEREDNLLWMRPGGLIESLIGPPIPDGDTSLQPDEDFFLMFNNPGDLFRIEAEPIADGMLVPEVELGRFSGAGTFFDWYRGLNAESEGETGSLSAYITSANHRYSVLRVIHGPNVGSDIPVGGPDYTYDLSIETLDPEDVLQPGAEEFPATISVELESGQQGLYDLEMDVGHEYTVDFNVGSFDRYVEVIDLNSGELIDSDRSSVSFMNRPDRDIVLGLRDDDGQPITESESAELDVEELDGAPTEIDVPGSFEDDIGSARDYRDYRVSAPAGELVEFRIGSEHEEPPSVEMFADPDAAVVTERVGDGTGVVAEVDEETEMLVRVTRESEDTVEFDAQLETVEPEEMEAPAEPRGDLQGLAGDWWSLDVGDYRRHVVNVDGPGEEVAYSMYDAETMQLLADDLDGGVVDTRGTDQAYLVVYDRAQEVGDSVDVGVSVAPVRPLAYTEEPKSVDFEEGLRPAIVAFETDQQGLTNVDVDGADDRPVATRLVDIRYQDVADDVDESTGTTTVDERPRRLRAVAAPGESDGETWSGEVQFTHLSGEDADELGADEATEDDPLELQQWPAAHRMSFDDGESVRSFVADLAEGSTVWAIAMPAEGPDAGAGPVTMTVTDPQGEQRDIARSVGDHGVVVDEYRVDTVGPWEFDLEGEAGGEYVLLMMQR